MSCSESVTKVVEKYVESMKESSADKVREAFHPNAKVVGHLHGDFLEMSTEDFAGFVAAQEPADCLLYTSPSPRDRQKSRMPSSA